MARNPFSTCGHSPRLGSRPSWDPGKDRLDRGDDAFKAAQVSLDLVNGYRSTPPPPPVALVGDPIAPLGDSLQGLVGVASPNASMSVKLLGPIPDAEHREQFADFVRRGATQFANGRSGRGCLHAKKRMEGWASSTYSLPLVESRAPARTATDRLLTASLGHRHRGAQGHQSGS
jgi:hypothetical protein